MTVDYEKDLLLVTAAGGKQASCLLPLLVKKWKRLRLNVLSAESKEKLEKQYPNAEVIQADTTDARACKALLEGVTACYLVTPPFNAHETEMGYNMIDAALANVRSGGPFKHMLHSSVIFPILRKLVNHDSKRYVEEYLVESGLPYTIVEPTHMMESFDVTALLSQEEPTFVRFWNPNVPFSFVSARDIAQAAANILDQRKKHFYATYQLVGTREPMDYNGVARIISEESGRELHVDQKPLESATGMFTSRITKLKAEDVPFTTAQAAGRMLMYYNDKGLIGNANVLEMLLGRTPLDYRAWVRLNVQEMQQKK